MLKHKFNDEKEQKDAKKNKCKCKITFFILNLPH